MIDPKTIKVGEWFWDKQRTRMGNTTMTRDSWYRAQVVELVKGGAMVRWNCNPPRRWGLAQLAKLQRRRRINGKLVGAAP